MAETGFIIANRDWSDSVKLDMGMRTFGRTAAEAWQRHVGGIIAASADFPIIVQRWSDRGYGPHRVEAALIPAPPPGDAL